MTLNGEQKDLLEFVKECHGEQKRKYSMAPYWTHVYSVADIASFYVKDAGIIEIAFCHDLFEDTACDSNLLTAKLKEIGYNAVMTDIIVHGVTELTDVYIKESYPELNRKERKHKEAIRLGQISKLAQSIKYADLTDNARSIVAGDPGFARVYLREKIDILNQMRQGNINLLIDCCYTLKSCLKQLDMELKGSQKRP
jgi:(p)ppGpp synthase/HD superfamily hydrolase